MSKIIELDKVSFSYGYVPVLRDISFTVNKGEFLGIIGPNAGGKSTLLKLILGLLHPNAGKITVFGEHPKKGCLRIGYVPQYPAFPRDFPINVLDMVLLGRLSKTTWRKYTATDREIAQNSLKAVEIADITNKTINSLSSGQLQRALIARALTSKPDVLILDESTANIDLHTEKDIFTLLKQYSKHMTVIVVSHDISFISRYVNRVACLNQTITCHTASEITSNSVEELYGKHVKIIQHTH